MATEEIKQATKDAAETVSDAITGSMATISETLGDAKEAVVDKAAEVGDDHAAHGEAIDSLQGHLEARAAEREEAQARAERR